MADDTTTVQGTTDTTAESAVQPAASLLTTPVEDATGTPAADPAAAAAPAAPDANANPAKPDGDQPDGDKADDAKPDGAPETYEFTAPDGVTLDAQAIAEFEPIAKELNLSNEQAQKIVDLQAKFVQQQHAQWEQTVDTWVAEIKADQEIGGAALTQNVRHAQQALTHFGTPALKAALDATRMGSHPELVRVFARIGKAMAEDTFVGGNKPSNANKSAAEILYGK